MYHDFLFSPLTIPNPPRSRQSKTACSPNFRLNKDYFFILFLFSRKELRLNNAVIQADAYPDLFHPIPLAPQSLQTVHNGIQLELHSRICGLRDKQRQGLGDSPPDYNRRQAEVDEQVDQRLIR